MKKQPEMDLIYRAWVEKIRPMARAKGKLAEYIPGLMRADPGALGICTVSVDGEVRHAGDSSQPFTLQSIAKVFGLIQALIDCGEEAVFRVVGMEPTGDPFNSIARLETSDDKKPFNPMINAGAIAVCSMICGQNHEERFRRIVDLVRRMADNPTIEMDEEVYRSELETADLNRSMAYFMKSKGVLQSGAEASLDLYTRICSLRVDCKDLAEMGAVLALDGLRGADRIIPERTARIAKRIMYTSGMYNASGEFAVRVGIPAKSGVSGGVMAVIPGRMGVGVYGPAIDDKGNSVGGVALLQELVDHYRISPF